MTWEKGWDSSIGSRTGSPYTAADDVNTIRFTPARRAASHHPIGAEHVRFKIIGRVFDRARNEAFAAK